MAHSVARVSRCFGLLLIMGVNIAYAQQNVSWKDDVDVLMSGNSLQKNAGCNGCNAGAASEQAIASGDGWAEFTATETNTQRQLGLSHSNPGVTTAEIDFSIRLTAGGIAEVRESDAYRTEVFYTANDRFRIAVVGPNVVYSKNGVVFRTTLAPAITYPLLVDTNLNTTAATLTNVTMSGSGAPEEFWTDGFHVTASGNSLQKTDGCNGCNAGAASVQSIASGDGWVEFTATETNTLRQLGLSHSNPGLTTAEIDFSIRLTEAGTAEVRESDAYRTETSYVANDRFRIAVVGANVVYSKNSIVFRTTLAPGITYPLLVDTTLLTTNATLTNVVISGGSPGGSGSVPTTYTARIDREVEEPEEDRFGTALGVPADPAVGAEFYDPRFPGSRLLRVTNAAAMGTSPAGIGYRTPSGPSQTAWSSDSSRFYVINTRGEVHVFNFNGGNPTQQRQLAWALEPAFSRVNPALMYGTRNITTHRIEQYDFNATAGNEYSLLLDLTEVDTTIPAGTYTGSLYSSGGPTERIVVRYGGTSQDMHDRVIIFDKNNPANRRMFNTWTTLGFRTHAVFIDQSGRYTVLYPAGVSGVQYIYDWEDGSFTVMDMFSNGHDALGYGVRINQEASNDQAYDAAQWQYRSLATPHTRSDLITPPLTPAMTYEAEHTSWHNAQPGLRVPVLSALYRYFDHTPGPNGYNGVARRPWDNEIIAIDTTGTTNPTVVWRFSLHWSKVAPDAGSGGAAFYYQPHPQIAPNGRWALFTSNWQKNLGDDVYSYNPANGQGDPTTKKRTDVFLVKLPH